MATAAERRQAKADQAEAIGRGSAKVPCAGGCGVDTFLKPNRLNTADGFYYHPDCLPRGGTLEVEGTVPKAVTTTFMAEHGVGPSARAEVREAKAQAQAQAKAEAKAEDRETKPKPKPKAKARRTRAA